MLTKKIKSVYIYIKKINKKILPNVWKDINGKC